MAYTRNEKETLEVDYPIERIWEAIPKVVETLEWKIEEKNDQAHKAKIRTKPSFMAYSTIILVDTVAVDEKTTRMTLDAETPVTTITSIADFGRTKDRLYKFIETLAKHVEKKT